MKILITGCAGLIGSNLGMWLTINTDHTIIGVDNFSGSPVNFLQYENLVTTSLDILIKMN